MKYIAEKNLTRSVVPWKNMHPSELFPHTVVEEFIWSISLTT
jgi:hypothetical protein